MIRLSAQYPSGNQTYSYPFRGGRGGSTPNMGGVDPELGNDITELVLEPSLDMTGDLIFLLGLLGKHSVVSGVA